MTVVQGEKAGERNRYWYRHRTVEPSTAMLIVYKPVIPLAVDKPLPDRPTYRSSCYFNITPLLPTSESSLAKPSGKLGTCCKMNCTICSLVARSAISV